MELHEKPQKFISKHDMNYDNYDNEFTPKLNENVDVIKNQYPRQERMKSERAHPPYRPYSQSNPRLLSYLWTCYPGYRMRCHMRCAAVFVGD